MIVSMESKTGSRPRNRRRVEEMSVVTRGMTSAPIVVEDEDDDVMVSSPTAFAQAKSQSDRRLTRQARAVAEEDLELRLGPGGASHYSSRSASQSSATQQPSLLSRRGRHARPTIDLTLPTRPAPVDEDCVFINENNVFPKSQKRKRNVPPVESSFMKILPPPSPVQEEPEDHKLKCVICMDKMKDETSTTCGHIFCQTCIQGAIKAQKKCPTCRKKLTMKNIHRIYI